VKSAVSRVGGALARLLHGPDALHLQVTASGPQGPVGVPRGGDGNWEILTDGGRACLSPDAESHYLYFVLPDDFLARATSGLWVEVEYVGDRFGGFRVQYASSDRAAEFDGLYKAAEQRWDGEAAGLTRLRSALFPLADFAPERRQNQGASFRVEFRQDVRITGMTVSRQPPAHEEQYRLTAPVPELKKMPGRFYPINYLFIEITNACNFKCTWCPDEVMGRKRGFMKKEKAFRLLEEIAEKRSRLGPLYPVKLHQMGEPMLHPDLVAIVERAETLGVGIELNTNCGLITEPLIDGLYKAGLTNLILSYQTPDEGSFKTRKAPRISFDAYRDKVRLAVERKVALGARTNLEIDIMNTKYADGYKIVSEDEQALAFLQDWIAFAASLEEKYGLPKRAHDWDQIRGRHLLDQDENGSRYTLLGGVNLIWKRCHSWGNAIETGGPSTVPLDPHDGVVHTDAPAPVAERNTYCPAPYEQFVIQWNGDVVSCCTDYEGLTKTANVFAESIESIWTGATVRRRREDMLRGQLLDVCAKCMGIA
jgi:MoaA/NifB/PqqE/SkfB family radical SAM enzyme